MATSYEPKQLAAGNADLTLAQGSTETIVTLYTATHGACIKRILVAIPTFTSNPTITVRLNVAGTTGLTAVVITLKSYTTGQAAYADILTTPFTAPLWMGPGDTITARAYKAMGGSGGGDAETLSCIIEGIEVGA